MQINHEKKEKLKPAFIYCFHILNALFDDMSCSACGLEEETQDHVIICSKLTKNKGDMNVKYEKLFNGTVNEKLIIAKMFKENYEVLENMKK